MHRSIALFFGMTGDSPIRVKYIRLLVTHIYTHAARNSQRNLKNPFLVLCCSCVSTQMSTQMQSRAETETLLELTTRLR